MINIAIVDDHQLFNEGLGSLLESFEKICVVGQFNDGVAFLKQLRHPSLNLVLMDIDMPILNGFETSKKALAAQPELKIILLSMHNDYRTIDEGLKLGINGFLLKNVSKEELKLAIETVIAGEDYYTDEIKNVIMRGHRSPHMHDAVNLTPREKEILKLITDELSTNEIAEKLFISSNTVETHRKNLLIKTGCKNSVGMALFAKENKLI